MDWSRDLTGTVNIIQFYSVCLFHINQDMSASVYPQQQKNTIFGFYFKFFIG